MLQANILDRTKLMLTPAIPIDEQERLAALHRLDILDTPYEDAYDRITETACEEFGVDVSMITLVDSDRQWFKAIHGVEIRESERYLSICAHTILHEECFVIPNGFIDSRFSDHPLVKDGPKFCFYAGCPIHDPTGYRIGAFCIIHTAPREFDCTDHAKLTALAKIVERQIANDYGVKSHVN